MPRAGRLDQIIQLQRFITVEDEMGQAVKTWTQYAEIWAGIEPSKSTESFREDQLNSRIDAVIVMRYRNDVDMKHRVLHKDRGGRVRTYELIGEVPSHSGRGYSELKFNAMLLHGEATV